MLFEQTNENVRNNRLYLIEKKNNAFFSYSIDDTVNLTGISCNRIEY